MLREFRDFIARGNVLDLAVAVIIGAAFAKITTSLTEDIIMPVVGAIFGGLDFSSHFIAARAGAGRLSRRVTDYAALKTAGAPVLGWGAVRHRADQLPDPRLHHLPAGAHGEPVMRRGPDAPAGPSEVDLLTEIRDELKRRA